MDHYFVRRAVLNIALLAGLTITAGCSYIAPVYAQGGQSGGENPPPTNPTFAVYDALDNYGPAFNRFQQDWANQITFASNAPVIRNRIITLYEGDFGLFPSEGPHIAEQDPTWLDRNIQKIRRDIDRTVPDRNFSGYLSLNWETWWPGGWDLHPNSPPKRAWREYIATQRPQVLAGKSPAEQEQILGRLWGEAAQRIFLPSMAEIKRLRPNAKLGIWGYPMADGADWMNPTRRARFQEMNDVDFRWMYDASDVLMPHVYAFYYSEPDPTRSGRDGQVSPETNLSYLRVNLAEYMRTSRGKPVMVFMWPRYHVNATRHAYQPLNDIDLRQTFTEIRASGANGAVIWEYIESPEHRDRLQTYINTRMGPVIAAVLATGGRNSDGSNGSGGNNSSAPPPGDDQNNISARTPGGKQLTTSTTQRQRTTRVALTPPVRTVLSSSGGRAVARPVATQRVDRLARPMLTRAEARAALRRAMFGR